MGIGNFNKFIDCKDQHLIGKHSRGCLFYSLRKAAFFSTSNVFAETLSLNALEFGQGTSLDWEI